MYMRERVSGIGIYARQGRLREISPRASLCHAESTRSEISRERERESVVHVGARFPVRALARAQARVRGNGGEL